MSREILFRGKSKEDYGLIYKKVIGFKEILLRV